MRKILFFILLFIVVSCSQQHDKRLIQVSELSSIDSQAALDSLAAIDYSTLSDDDKEYYDFLLVKTRDKAFIPHTSDSLIVKVIANEEKHKSRGRYTEALYYGGRVYHDLGDYPTALNYYQNALDCKPKDKLKGCILVQIGSVLKSLRLYEQAIPYVEQALAIDSAECDTANLMYDTELLGTLNMNAKKFVSAERQFNRAKSFAGTSSPRDTTMINLDLAALKYCRKDLDAALALIRPVMKNIDSYLRPEALAYACDIYRHCGISDTALLYAHELIDLKSDNQNLGYRVILSEELKGYTSHDSIIRYAIDYTVLTEKILNQNGNQDALMQNSFYNYQLHQRERIKAESANNRLHKWITFITLIVLALIVCVLYLKNRNKTQLLQLHEAIDNINELRRSISESSAVDEGAAQISATDFKTQSIQDLRARLRDELMSIHKNAQKTYCVPSEIIQSETYKQIRQYIAAGQVIPSQSDIWAELESLVLKCSPDFMYRLNLLTGGNLKPSDYRLALLIKCNIIPSNMAILIGRTKATIAYQRKKLCEKVFDKSMEIGTIDEIIRLL
jgi:Tfp pilus assembly protein PilF